MTTLALQHVAIQRGDRLILQGLSFSAVRGELIALMGASGAGKTTLLRAIGGLDPIAAGTIEIGGVRLTPGHLPRGRTLRDLHRSVGLVFQFHHLFANMSVLRNVSLAPLHVLGEPPRMAERRARDLLDMLDVGGLANARPHELSGGEAQRVAIARALAVEPMVLLMDEPTASLDHARRDDLAAALKRLAAHGRTVIVASHDRQFALACADRAVMLDAGRVTRVGATAEVL